MRENKEGDFNSGKKFVCKVCVDAKEETVKPGEEISFFDRLNL